MDKDIPGLDCGEEAIPFYEERGVHIIPIYALTFIVDLPMRPPGQTFSNWDIREKIKTFTHPHELKDLKIVESSDEHIKFTTHVVNIDIMDEIITLLDNITFRAPGFESALKVAVRVGGYPFPKPEDWKKHFRGQRLRQDEPGERPDTVHIAGLPYEWFAPNISDDVTSIMLDIMSQYGKVRQIDIPQEDPYRCEMEPSISGMKLHWFDGSFSPFFEMYVQYEDYEGFYNAMTKMGGHQLVRRAASGILSEYQYTIDFDRNSHLSNRIIIQRELARQCIIYRKKHEAEEREKKIVEEIKRKTMGEIEKGVIEAKVRVCLEQQERQREFDEEHLRKKLKDKKRASTIARINESENLLKFLLVDEAIRVEWEREQKKRPADKIREYVKANKLPGENALREKLLKKRELEMRSEVVGKTFRQTNGHSKTKLLGPEELALSEALDRELTQTQFNIHRQRQRMYKEMKEKRDKLLRDTEHRLHKFRSKFKEDSVFDRQKLAAPENKSITINIKTKSIEEYIERNKSST
uniref:Uncharacterized protein n=1 Tax=Panagrolaimus sp. PS1159 TaxID=55785 RepID=A0AC35GPA7_9BILA